MIIYILKKTHKITFLLEFFSTESERGWVQMDILFCHGKRVVGGGYEAYVKKNCYVKKFDFSGGIYLIYITKLLFFIII